MNSSAGERIFTRSMSAHAPALAAADAAANLLRNEILAGQHYSGEQLRETHISTRLGLSRNTIREAYRKLEAEGLVIHVPNRGVYVAGFDLPRVKELYAFRLITECGTLRSLSKDEACRLAMNLTDTLSNTDNANIANRNNEFHLTIVAASHSPELVSTARSILAQLRLCFISYPASLDIHLTFEERHKAIIDVLSKGDTAGAANLMKTYLRDSYDTLCRAMSSAGQ